MKSSSKLFPVRLMSADVQNGLAEDVYLLKPNNSADPSVELALTHLSLADESCVGRTEKPALILLHGSYQNRRLWWADSGPCLAKELVLQGLDVWLLELRGHGLSPFNQRYEENTLADYATYDLPAVEMFVRERSDSSVHWLGHGTGAGVLLAALALSSITLRSGDSVMGVGAPFFRPKWSRIPGVSTLMAAGRATMDLDYGPEAEPLSFLQDLVREGRRFTRRGESLGLDLWQELSALSHSVHWLCSEQGLAQLDEEFPALHTQGVLKAMLGEPHWDDDLSQSSVFSVLTEPGKIASLSADIISLIETGETPHHVLPPGEASSAARRLSACV